MRVQTCSPETDARLKRNLPRPEEYAISGSVDCAYGNPGIGTVLADARQSDTARPACVDGPAGVDCGYSRTTAGAP
jgi:hypothetical protein